MALDVRPRGRFATRIAWTQIIVLLGIGVATGLYLAGPVATRQSKASKVAEEVPSSPAPVLSTAEVNDGAARQIGKDPERARAAPDAGLCRFSLTAADAKDTQGAPDIAVDGAGRVHLVWASQTGETEQTALHATSTNGAVDFSSPQALVRSAIAYRSQGQGKKGYAVRMAPHVVTQADSVFVAWTEATPDEPAARMVLATATNRSGEFSDPLCVHVDKQASPTFTALAIGPRGELACSWLDSRSKAQRPYASLRPAGASAFLPEFTLPGGTDDTGVCPCCPTGATFAPDGTLFIGFRNLADGHRDIAIVRLRPGAEQFEGPFDVVPPTWEFDGCPHDGPALVVAGGRIHVAWMDAHTGAQRVYYGHASLDDLQFRVQAMNAAGPGTQGNPKLFADAAGGLHAVWEESLMDEPAAPAAGSRQHHHGPPQNGAGRGICHAFAPPGAESFGPARLLQPVAGSYQTRPAISGGGNGRIYVAWCELDENGKSIVVRSFEHDEQLSQVESRLTSAQRSLAALGFRVERRLSLVPTLVLEDSHAARVSLSELRGNWVLLEFWGISCAPCRTALPALQRLSEAWETKPFKVVPVCTDADDVQSAQDVLSERASGLTACIDPTGLGIARFGVQALPATWLVDPQGRVRATRVGAIDWDSEDVRSALAAIFSEPTDE